MSIGYEQDGGGGFTGGMRGRLSSYVGAQDEEEAGEELGEVTSQRAGYGGLAEHFT